jgi:hypothetical protein
MPFSERRDLDGDAIEAAMQGAVPGSYDAHVLAWLLNQVPLPERESTRYWRLWSANAFASALASALVIALILCRAPLRRVSYNHLVVGLAVPDLLFALFCGTTCLLNATHGHWYDGDGSVFGGGWICDFQAFYSVFGTAGSMWVNVLVTFELEAVSRSMSTGMAYARPTTREIYGRLAAVYAFVIAISWFVSFGYRFLPGLRRCRCSRRARCRRARSTTRRSPRRRPCRARCASRTQSRRRRCVRSTSSSRVFSL